MSFLLYNSDGVQDSDSDDEVLPPEDWRILQGQQGTGNPEDEIAELEAELAALQQEEEAVIEMETKLIKNRPASRPRTGTVAGTIRSNTYSKLGKDLKLMIDDAEFSDISLVAEGKEKVRCHKVILAARCTFFRKTFETNKAATVVNLKEVKYPVLRALVDYLYTSTINVHPDWAEHLAITAAAYDLPELEELCDTVMGLSKDPMSRKSSVAQMRSASSGEIRPMSDLGAVETAKMRETRKKVALEIHDTEKSYVTSLQLVFKELITPLKQAAQGPNPILQAAEIQELFSYWEVLLKCHVSLLKTLESRMAEWSSRPEVGDIFLEKTAFIKLYKHYINNFDKSIIAYRQLLDKNSKWKEFLERLEHSPRMNKMSLQAFLIMPVQRIPRYVMLLQDMYRNTVSTHQDFENLEEALESMKELAGYINENKNDADEINKILAIQNRLIGWPADQPLVRPRRRLLREGSFLLNKKKVAGFLFTDAFLFGKPKGKNKLKYKGLILLTTSSLNADVKTKGEKFHFELIASSGKLYFNVVPPEEKESWHKSLVDAIDVSHKDLLSSAFAGFEQHDSEGSKQFQKFREEEYQKKRSQTAVSLLKSENEYFQSLESIVKIFVIPLKEAASSSYIIIPMNDIVEMFANIEAIHKVHAEFVKKLSNRVASWDAANSLVGDLFLELVVDCLKIYSQFIDMHPRCVDAIDRCMLGSISFQAFLVEKEKDYQTSLIELMTKPLKRLSYYFIDLKELSNYTPERHADSEKLKVVLTRLQEYNQQQKNQKIISRKDSKKLMKEQGRKNSMSSISKGPRSPVGSPPVATRSAIFNKK